MMYLVDNREHMPVINADGSEGAIHAHLTEIDEVDGLSKPIAFSMEKAQQLAALFAGDASYITKVPADMQVILHDSVYSGMSEEPARFDQRPHNHYEDTMPDNNNYLVENTANLPVMIGGEPVGPIHNYITKRVDKDASLPVAFSKEEAERVAEVVGGTAVPVPGDVKNVVLDRSARKLPTTSAVMPLEQVSLTEM